MTDTPSWTYRLPVVYVPQQGTGANYRARDCGVACAVAVARYAYVRDGYLDPVNFTVDDAARKTSLANADSGLTCPQIARLLEGYGLKADGKLDLSLDKLQALIRADNPPIVLCNYRHINKAHKGDMGHFITLCGYRADAFLAHDPYLLGKDVTVQNADLSRAMHDVLLFTNVPYQGVILA